MQMSANGQATIEQPEPQEFPCDHCGQRPGHVQCLNLNNSDVITLCGPCASDWLGVSEEDDSSWAQ
jgi:hypothetical protein